ncbi:MAG: peptidoglycan DD-metalloendopeptidase family protein [Abditibacteriaceae bacterium]
MFPKRTFIHFTFVLLLAAALLISSPPAQATSVGQIGNSIKHLWQERSGHQQSAHQAQQKASALKAQAGSVHVRLEKQQQLLLQANDIFENYQHQIKQTEANIVETRHRQQIVTKRYNQHMVMFGQRLAAMQRTNPMGYLEVLLGSRTFSDLSRRIYLFNAILDRDANLQHELKKDKAEMATLQNTLMSQWQQRNKLVQATNQEKTRIYLAQQKVQSYWKQIKSSQYEQWSYAQAEQQSSHEIASMISDLQAKRSTLIAEYQARRAAERAKSNAVQHRVRVARRVKIYKNVTDEHGHTRRVPTSRVVYEDHMVSDNQSQHRMRESFSESGGSESNGVSGSGKWVLPVHALLSSPFGMRFHPILHRMELHSGDDLAAGYGTPIHAAKSGTVLYAGWKTGFGNTIMIDVGNGLVTLYGHTSKMGVSPGEHVNAGQYIGNVGSSGWATGPHLHFEIRKNGRPINPMPYLKKAGF